MTQHHRCAEELPTCQDLLLVKEREGIRVAELLEEEERLIDQGPGTVVAVLIGEEQLRLLLVLVLELREDGESLVAVMGHELVPDLYESICRTGHSREDNNLRLIGSCDEVRLRGLCAGQRQRRCLRTSLLSTASCLRGYVSREWGCTLARDLERIEGDTASGVVLEDLTVVRSHDGGCTSAPW